MNTMEAAFQKVKGDLPELIREEGAVKVMDRRTSSTYEIISKVAYLIGVPESIFRNENEPPKLEWFDELEQLQEARIIRNLSIVRTALSRHFKNVQREIYYNISNLNRMPTYIPQPALLALERDEVPIVKANRKAEQYLDDINNLILERINQCRDLFPLWIQWDYIKELFVIPKGESNRQAAWNTYVNNLQRYPYQMFLHWKSPKDCGNMLYNDKKFAEVLYEMNGCHFIDSNKVSDASDYTKGNIYDFLDQSTNVIFIVDCENSDPYKLCAVIKNLDQEYVKKIQKIILYDDVHTVQTWKILERFIDVPIQRELVDRIKQDKSLVDIRLAAGACAEFYKNQIDSFLLVSSDSDYWGLISSLAEAKFLVMVESSKCGPDIKNAMREHGIFYCYIDDFCGGNSNQIRTMAVLDECRNYIDRHMELNMQKMLISALRAARTDMTNSEKAQFYERYSKRMRLKVESNGDITIVLGQ